FVVLEGEVEVLRSDDADEVPILVFGPGSFVGELTLLTGQRRFLNCRVTEAGRVLVIPEPEFRRLMSQRPALADTIFGALVARREILRSGAVMLGDIATGEKRTISCSGLFCFIGARPATTWLGDDVLLDQDGFVLTDRQLPERLIAGASDPLPFETSVPGVFAAGDVRHGSMKRVAVRGLRRPSARPFARISAAAGGRRGVDRAGNALLALSLARNDRDGTGRLRDLVRGCTRRLCGGRSCSRDAHVCAAGNGACARSGDPHTIGRLGTRWSTWHPSGAVAVAHAPAQRAPPRCCAGSTLACRVGGGQVPGRSLWRRHRRAECTRSDGRRAWSLRLDDPTPKRDSPPNRGTGPSNRRPGLATAGRGPPAGPREHSRSLPR